MNELDGYIASLEKFAIDLPNIVSKSILKNEKKILGRLKLRLYNYGVDGSGNKIEPEYSSITIQHKKEKNQTFSHVTLRDTGTFYASLFLEYSTSLESLFVNSNDEKGFSLVKKYGEDILGLTIQEQEWIILFIIEPEVNKVLNNINNKNIDIE